MDRRSNLINWLNRSCDIEPFTTSHRKCCIYHLSMPTPTIINIVIIIKTVALKHYSQDCEISYEQANSVQKRPVRFPPWLLV